MTYRLLTRISGCNPSKFLQSFLKMSTNALEEIKEVDIDPDGTFKYILIKVYGGDKDSDTVKTIVRGYKRCAYHADIYEEVNSKELAPKNLDAECLGGGRIQHNPQEKKLKVYGYSQGYGKADHTISVGLLQRVYPGYSITWTDEGY